MTDNRSLDNPFQITSPEDLTAKETVDMFVDVFTDFPKIIDPGHMFLFGPRGVGKSMMFRYLQSDCQCIVKNCDFSELPFLGIYIPIKNVSFIKTELQRLDDRHASEMFNEHLMISVFVIRVIDSLLKDESAIKSISATSLFKYYKEIFLPLFFPYSFEAALGDGDYSCEEIFRKMNSHMDKSYKTFNTYLKRLSFSSVLPEYKGPLLDYQDFLVPLLSNLVNVQGFPKGTIYLMIDDAHFLSEIQTRILNSWIATRTSRKISLKVSSQYNYKSYYTTTGATIDSPHDYSEIDMTSVYTNTIRSKYRDRIVSIISKRLKLTNIDVDVENFFPYDIEQEEAISKIADDYKMKYDAGKGRGYNRSDDANRYARPDFIRNLAGSRKSSSTYSYSGFNQLVHLSSGIVRYFLESAHLMYSKEKANNGNQAVKNISISVQNEVSRSEANSFLFFELEKYKMGWGGPETIPKEQIECLSNLIQGLGELFHQILISNRSERKVFSIAISDRISERVEEILAIGVNFGYFHRSTIGRKESKSCGRTNLFIMNRRLAPIWNLDPTGFSGYLFMRNSILEEGLINPQGMLRRIDQNGELDGIEYLQLSLFAGFDEPSIEVLGEENI